MIGQRSKLSRKAKNFFVINIYGIFHYKDSAVLVDGRMILINDVISTEISEGYLLKKKNRTNKNKGKINKSGKSTGKESRYINVDIRRELIEEVGGKCANPGCPSLITEFHHLDEWSIWKTHDSKRMIAICPNCHSYAHKRGTKLTNNELLQWKANAGKRNNTKAFPVFVTPSDETLFRFGNFKFKDNTKAFAVGSSNIEITVDDNGVVFINIIMFDSNGETVVEVKSNTVITTRDDVNFEVLLSGHIRVTTNLSNGIIPEWAVVNFKENNIQLPDSVTLLEIVVKAPGEVTVQGLIQTERKVYYITENKIYFTVEGGTEVADFSAVVHSLASFFNQSDVFESKQFDFFASR